MSINTAPYTIFAGQVLIGNDSPSGIPPKPTQLGTQPVSAVLELQSSDSSLLLSRLIPSELDIPYPGMLFYNPLTNELNYIDNTGPQSITASPYIPPHPGPDPVIDDSNVFVGKDAGEALAEAGIYAGTGLTGLGYQVLQHNVSGSYNTGTGTQALNQNVSGNLDSAYGYQSSFSSVNASGNTSGGAYSLRNTVSGSMQTAIGLSSLEESNGNYNVALGGASSRYLQNGLNNTSVGTNNSISNISGSNNSSLGFKGLLNNINSYNSSLGFYSGSTFSNNSYCTFLGANADAGNDNLVNSGAIGANATVMLNDNIIIGNQASVGIGKNVANATLDLGNVDNRCDVILSATNIVPDAPDELNALSLYNTGQYLYYVRQDGRRIELGVTGQDDTINLYSGTSAGSLQNTGAENTIVGINAGNSMTDGSDNVFLGYNAGTAQVNYGSIVLIGHGTDATTNDLTGSVAVGGNIEVGGSASVSLGYGVINLAPNSTILGDGAFSEGDSATLVGKNTNASAIADRACGFGFGANVTGPDCISVGNASLASNSSSIAIGNGANSTADNAIGIGHTAIASGVNSIVLGATSTATAQDAITIGFNSHTTAQNSIVIGNASSTAQTGTVVIGETAEAANIDSIAIGHSANVSADYSIALGPATIASGTGSIAIGHTAHATATNAVAIGTNVTAADIDTIILGSGNFIGINTGTPLYTIDLAPFAGEATMNFRLSAPPEPSPECAILFNAGGVLSWMNQDGEVFPLIPAPSGIVINTGTGLTGGPITGSGTISVANTGATAGTYTFPLLDINAQGQVTSVSSYGMDSGITGNLFLGQGAGNNTTTSLENIGIGYRALASLDPTSNGIQNFAGGYYSMEDATEARFNVALGHKSLQQNILGNNNTALGHEAGQSQDSYLSCTFVGQGADASADGLSNATAIGANSIVDVDNALILGASAFVGIGNTAPAYPLSIGEINGQSGIHMLDTDGALPPSDTNSFVLYNSGNFLYLIDWLGDVYNISPPTNSIVSGDYDFPSVTVNNFGQISSVSSGGINTTLGNDSGNIWIGSHCGSSTSGGSLRNIGIGPQVHQSVNGAVGNLAFGNNAHQNLTTGSYNTAVGIGCSSSLVATYGNTAMGVGSLLTLNAGDQNTALGGGSLGAATFSVNTLGVGFYAAGSFDDYTNCTFVGFNADATTNGLTNSTAIGANATVSVDNALILGASAFVGIGNTAPAYPLSIGEINGQSGIHMLDTDGALPPSDTNSFVLYNSGNFLYLIDWIGDVYNISPPTNSIVSGDYDFASVTINNFGQVSAIHSSGIDGPFGDPTGNLWLGSTCGTATPGGSFFCVGIGPNVHNSLNGGISNVAIGAQAQFSLTTGSGNTTVGHASLGNISSNNGITCIGSVSMQRVSSGNNGISIGTGIGENVLSFDGSIAIGSFSAAAQTTYTNCVFLGQGADASVDSLTNAIAIGYGAVVSESNALVLGNGCKVGIGTSAPHSELHLAGVFQQQGILSRSGSDLFRGQTFVQTTDATPTTLYSLTIRTDIPSTIELAVRFTAIDSTGTKSAYTGNNNVAFFWNGTTTAQTAAFPGITVSHTSGFTATAAWVLSGNTLSVVVTGIAATTINWASYFEYFSITNA